MIRTDNDPPSKLFLPFNINNEGAMVNGVKGSMNRKKTECDQLYLSFTS